MLNLELKFLGLPFIVAVKKSYPFTFGCLNASVARGVCPGVFLVNISYLWVSLADHVGCIICRTVVNNNQLKVLAGLPYHTFNCPCYHILPIESRYYYACGGFVHINKKIIAVATINFPPLKTICS
jgi:hypothetical protein